MSVKRICDYRFPCTRSTVYDTEQVTSLDLVAEVASKVNEVVDEVNDLESEIDAKLDDTGNFKGTWFGLLPKDYPIAYKDLIDIREYGCVCDGVTDDTEAFKKAMTDAQLNGKKVLISGVVRITEEIEINRAIWIDSNNLNADRNEEAKILFDNDEVDGSLNAIRSLFRFKRDVIYELNGIRIENVKIEHVSTVKNQHSFTFQDSFHSFMQIRNVFFTGMTGYALNFVGNTYSQNVVFENLSFTNVGGCVGRADGASTLIVTLARFTNLNLDNNINVISPQTDIWNLVGWRSLYINTILTEGTLVGLTTPLNGLKLGGQQVEINNCWFEFSSTEILTNTIVIADNGNYEISKPRGIIEGSPLLVETGVKATVKIKDANLYNGIEENMFLNSEFSSIQIDGAYKRTYEGLPESSMGKLSVKNAYADLGNGFAIVDQSNELELAHFKGGLFEDQKHLKLIDGANVQDRSIVDDPFGDEGRVLKITSTDGTFLPQIRYKLSPPSNVYGSTLVFALRYYVDTLDVQSAVNVFLGYALTLSKGIELKNREKNKWVTAYFVINNVTGDNTFTTQTINADLVNSHDLYISSMKVISGKDIPAITGMVDVLENIEVKGLAIPTLGDFKVGDRIVNVNPTVGQPKAWVCTVAGNPGTWVSEGNL